MAALLVVAAAVRVADIFWHPNGPDEGFTMDLASGSWTELIQKTAADTHPPLHYMMVKLWLAVVPGRLFAAKSLTIIFAVATIWLTFLLAKRWFTERAAWLAAACMAAAPYQIYWSHIARSHPIMPFFVTALFLLSWEFVEHARRRDWLAIAAIWTICLYMNYMIVVIGVVWAAVFIFEAGEQRRKIALALSPIPAAIAFIPWLGIVRSQMEKGPMNIAFFQQPMTPISLYYHSLFGQPTYLPPAQSGVLYLLALAVFVAISAAGAKAVGSRLTIWLILLALPGLPMVIAWARHWTLAERHLLFALPFFMAYWGASLDRAISYFFAWARFSR
ncbi:hypothetical protein BH09SUM1_BH09SUM1_17050 [soil metagenome]